MVMYTDNNDNVLKNHLWLSPLKVCYVLNNALLYSSNKLNSEGPFKDSYKGLCANH